MTTKTSAVVYLTPSTEAEREALHEILVTTSHYSKSAVIEAAETGKNPIVLVDGHEFASIVGSLKIAIE